MSVVAAFVYRDGLRVREASLSEGGLELEPGEFVWIGLLEPQEAELRTLQRRFGHHPLADQHSQSAHHQPNDQLNRGQQ
jgi:magnesium transporter